MFLLPATHTRDKSILLLSESGILDEFMMTIFIFGAPETGYPRFSKEKSGLGYLHFTASNPAGVSDGCRILLGDIIAEPALEPAAEPGGPGPPSRKFGASHAEPPLRAALVVDGRSGISTASNVDKVPPVWSSRKG